MFEDFNKIEKANLSEYSTMKVGGCARYLLFPKTVDELKSILHICRREKIKSFILGNGSNVLFDDNGFNGAIISLKEFNKIEVQDEIATVGAGVNLFALNLTFKQFGLSGLEWSYGIPASLGGFVFMNGGCFGHEICEFIENVCVLDGDSLRILSNKDCGFAYRTSALQKYVILGAKLRLKHEESEKIAQNMNFFYNKKKESQPCDQPSLGSVFKIIKTNPEIHPAKLIDKMGLKGVKIGRAEVSKKHAGFIVNLGGATSQDVLDLICFLEGKLKSQGVIAQREIVVLREDVYE